MKKVHIKLEDDVYEGIWEIVKKRYVSPIRKFHVVVNESLHRYIELDKMLSEKGFNPEQIPEILRDHLVKALEEYIEKHKDELES